MKTKIIHVLCEGQTEQGFVDEVLRPYLLDKGFTSVKSVLVTTNKKENAHGGMSSYSHARLDLNLMLHSNPDSSFERHLFTTMFDLYALPNDFPGYEEAEYIEEPYARVNSLESTRILQLVNMSKIDSSQLKALLMAEQPKSIEQTIESDTTNYITERINEDEENEEDE